MKMSFIKRGFLLLSLLLLFTGCRPVKTNNCLGQYPNSLYEWDAGDTLNGIRVDKEISSDFEKEIRTPLVYSMAFDPNNNLWYLSSINLNKYSPGTGDLVTYDLPEPIIRGDVFVVGNHIWMLVELNSGGIDFLDFNIYETGFNDTEFSSAYKGSSKVTSYFDRKTSQLWVLISDKKLVSFDLGDNNVIEYNSNLINTTANSKIAYSEGYVWVANINGDSIIVTRYQLPALTNGEVILNTSFGRYPPSILIDNNNVLIAGDLGKLDIAKMIYLDPGYSWDLFIRSNSFILPSEWYQGRFRWIRPEVIFINAQNNYWFSGFGLVNYNAVSGLWCRYTYDDYQNIAIAENDDHEIWIFFDGWLYSMQ